MFGKEASEVMWITESVEKKYYCTCAENQGCVYTTKLSLNESGRNTILTMTFTGEAQTLIAKILSAFMGVFVKSSMKKLLCKDLEDINKYVEQS